MKTDRQSDVRERLKELEREIEQLRLEAGETGAPRRPAKWALRAGLLLIAIALAAIFLAGYLPRSRRESQITIEARERVAAVPVVRVAEVRLAAAISQLTLPGTFQAIAETPVLARADGYLKRRYADIGDRVETGQLLGEIEAPELDQQARQARASLEQARAALEQAQAHRDQERAQAELARVTAARYANLLRRGVVSKQENDQQQANATAHAANVVAFDKAVSAAKENIAAAEANLARIDELRGYLKVKAPFAGVVTLRNVDNGALVTAGNTLLYRIAQTAMLRTYINVPQAYAATLKPGTNAAITLADRPGQRYAGKVTRAASALDPATRTMLVEVQVANRDGSLLPGMYVQVAFEATRKQPPLLVEADAVEDRAQGTLVAVVGPGNRVAIRKITLGRDYGSAVEVLGGLREGERVILNPNDDIRDGVTVKPVASGAKRQ